jgi:hypothetical protein
VAAFAPTAIVADRSRAVVPRLLLGLLEVDLKLVGGLSHRLPNYIFSFVLSISLCFYFSSILLFFCLFAFPELVLLGGRGVVAVGARGGT